MSALCEYFIGYCTCTGKTCRFLFSWVWNISNLFFVQEFKVRKTIKNKQKLCWWIRVYTGLNKPRINGRKLLNCKVAVKRCAQADRTKRNLDLYSWRPRLQCAAEIRKHSFELTNTKLLELEAFGKRHGKRSSNWRNLKTPVLRFCVDWTFWVYRNRWIHDNHVNSLTEPSSNTNPKWPVIVATGEAWTGHYSFMTGLPSMKNMISYNPRQK